MFCLFLFICFFSLLFADRFEFALRHQSLGLERVLLDRALHRNDPARTRNVLDPGNQGIRKSGKTKPQPVVQQLREDQGGGRLPYDVRSRFEKSEQRRIAAGDGERRNGV